jgi:hypothetical protein
MSGHKGAAGILDNLDEVRNLAAYLVKRLSSQDHTESEDIEKHMENILERWIAKARSYTAGLHYTRNRDLNGNLLVAFDTLNPDLGMPPDTFPTMNQMRNVDPMCGMVVLP